MPTKTVPTAAHEKLWKETQLLIAESYVEKDPKYWPTVMRVYLSKVKAQGLEMPDIDVRSPKIKDQLKKVKKSMLTPEHRRIVQALLKQVEARVDFEQATPSEVALRAGAGLSNLKAASAKLQDIQADLEKHLEKRTPLKAALSLPNLANHDFQHAFGKAQSLLNATETFEQHVREVHQDIFRKLNLGDSVKALIKDLGELEGGFDALVDTENSLGSPEKATEVLDAVKALRAATSPVFEDFEDVAKKFKDHEKIFKSLRSARVARLAAKYDQVQLDRAQPTLQKAVNQVGEVQDILKRDVMPEDARNSLMEESKQNRSEEYRKAVKNASDRLVTARAGLASTLNSGVYLDMVVGEGVKLEWAKTVREAVKALDAVLDENADPALKGTVADTQKVLKGFQSNLRSLSTDVYKHRNLLTNSEAKAVKVKPTVDAKLRRLSLAKKVVQALDHPIR